MKNKTIKIASIAALALGAFMAAAWPFFGLMVRCKKNRRLIKRQWFQLSHMKINHPRNKFEREYEEGKAWCRQQKMRDCYIRSVDGLILHALYLPAKNPERYVLLSHGYKATGFGDFAYTARFLHENHCNLLFIDQRCCGESEGEYITFGAMEQYDVQKWCFYLARRNRKKLPIYLYGESMGASTILMASGHKLPREVRGLIADCGFRSMRGQVQDMAKNWFHLNWVELLLFRLDLFCTVLAGFRMSEADTAKALRTNRRPVLFFHGSMDTYVDPKNTRYNYSICRAPKDLVIIPGARHICSVYENPDLYRWKLMDFFKKYD